MDSRIFELSKKPIFPSYRLCSRDLDGTTIDCVADYINDIDDAVRKNSIEDLSRNGLTIDFDKETVTLSDRKAYFKESYAEMINLLEVMKDTTIDDFSNPVDTENEYNQRALDLAENIYMMNSCYNTELDIYVCTKENGIQTLDDFVRNVWKDDTSYYIGGIIEYHY